MCVCAFGGGGGGGGGHQAFFSFESRKSTKQFMYGVSEGVGEKGFRPMKPFMLGGKIFFGTTHF